jgi:hypothetical protein
MENYSDWRIFEHKTCLKSQDGVISVCKYVAFGTLDLEFVPELFAIILIILSDKLGSQSGIIFIIVNRLEQK